jgi:hypothetical protein
MSRLRSGQLPDHRCAVGEVADDLVTLIDHGVVDGVHLTEVDQVPVLPYDGVRGAVGASA